MFKPGTDESNVKMSDVLCDFCRREWTEDMPFIEGHRGCMICGNCLAVGYHDLVNLALPGVTEGYCCTLCREDDDDRAALDRTGEPGWPSPVDGEVVACRRCVKRAAGALHTDKDHEWRKPTAS